MMNKLSNCLLAIMLFLFSTTVIAEGYTPMRGAGIKAAPVSNNTICLACNVSNLGNVTDASLTNYAEVGQFLSLASGNGVSVKNSFMTYPAGYVVGFMIDRGSGINGAINAEVLSSISIVTLKNNVVQETTSNATLVSVPLFGGPKNKMYYQFVTSKSFDEIRIIRSALLGGGLGTMNVYYAFAFDPANMKKENNGICDDIIGGNSEADNFAFTDSRFISPLTYMSEQSRRNIADGDKNSYGDMIMPAGLLGSYSVGVLEKNQVYPAGSKAGFVISPQDQNTLFNLQTLSSITIETYLFGKLQDSQTYGNSNGLINLTVLSFGSNKQKLSVTTTKDFNEVRLKVTQVLGVNLGSIRVYYAFEEPQSCDCKQYLQTDRTAPYKGKLLTGNLPGGASSLFFGKEQWIGAWNTFLGNITVSNMSNPGNIVDANPSNATTFTVFPLTIGTEGSVAVESEGTTYPAGTVGGFIVDKGGVLTDWSILSSIRLQFYNGNTLVQSETNANNGLISVKFITSNSGKTYIAAKAKFPFNRMRITFKQGISISLAQSYNVFNAFIEGDTDGDGTPDCYDMCPGGDDSKDSDGDGIPDACDTNSCATSDKSSVLDSDGDGIVDACDLDTDNDGIPDYLEEDQNKNLEYEDDDFEGDTTVDPALGDGIANYKDYDSDNDGVLDLFESGIPNSVIAQIDTDLNGIIDSNQPVGKNGLADVLETFPDSGVLKYPIADTDGDTIPDFLDLRSNGVTLDIDAINKGGAGIPGYGYIYRTADADSDGIQDTTGVIIDTDTTKRGAPGSPLSPYYVSKGSNRITPADITIANDIKVYTNPVKAGEVVNIVSAKNAEALYSIYSAQGQLVKSGKVSGNGTVDTSSLVTGVYILKTQTGKEVKSFKIIVK